MDTLLLIVAWGAVLILIGTVALLVAEAFGWTPPDPRR